MTDQPVILITGVAGYWGGRLAERLALTSQPADAPVLLGLDSEPPAKPLAGLDFIQADVRNPLLVDLLRSERIDTLVHLALRENYRSSERAFDLNVIGTMKVLAAAAEAGVRKVILRSSTMVYGALPTNPAFLAEDQPLNGGKAGGLAGNLVEIEAFVNGFRRQSPNMLISLLRFANPIGPGVDAPLVRLLRMNPPLILLGFDPLLQVIHEDDLVGALAHAVQNDRPGIFNIAAEKALPLGKILGLAGRLPLPVIHPFAYWGRELLRLSGRRPQSVFPIEPDYLRYSWVADLERMRTVFGFTPTYTAEEALREFAGQMRLKKFKPETPDLAFDQERLRDTLERRKRMRQQSEPGSEGDEVSQ